MIMEQKQAGVAEHETPLIYTFCFSVMKLYASQCSSFNGIEV